MKIYTRGFSPLVLVVIIAVVIIAAIILFFMHGSPAVAPSQNLASETKSSSSIDTAMTFSQAKSVAAADISSLDVSTPSSVGLCYSSRTCSGVFADHRIVNGQGALEYCQNLSEKNHTDWRLPTIAELLGVYKKLGNDAAYASGNYWSNVLTTISSKDQHYSVNFIGDQTPAGDSDNDANAVICVRP